VRSARISKRSATALEAGVELRSERWLRSSLDDGYRVELLRGGRSLNVAISMADFSAVKFSAQTLKEYEQTLARYPTRQAALLPTLWLAMREFGWISPEVEQYVARLMGIAPSHVRAVVSFYEMFHRKPVGRWHLAVCTNLSCRLRGADRIVQAIREKLNLADGDTTADGKFTLQTVQCMASCGSAPMLQLNQDLYYENLTVESVIQLIDELAARVD
jgi:NADH-quinone oxidoreductase subunit E